VATQQLGEVDSRVGGKFSRLRQNIWSCRRQPGLRLSRGVAAAVVREAARASKDRLQKYKGP
jgi:hypothetical protein